VTALIRRVAAVAVVAIAVGACSSTSVLATVNGTDITRDQLNGLRPSYSEASSLDAEQVRQDLTRLIVAQAARDAAQERFGVTITDAEIADRIANPPARYAAVIGPADQFEDTSDEAIRISAIQSLIRDAVVPRLVDDDAGGFAALLADRPEEVSRMCVRHISTATVEEAEDVLARLDAGEDFVAVAAEVSTDQASPEGLIVDGEGNCLLWMTRAGIEFANLAATTPLDDPVGPIEASNEWNIIRVEDRVVPTAAEYQAAPMEYLDPDYASSLYTQWFNDVVREADVTVSATVGRWSDAGVGIAPPGE
jgi:parvulin-like peptidyl-prolyl isomerase